MTTTRRTHRDPRNYQYVIRHEDQATPSRNSFASPDTAIAAARRGYEHGACEAYVVRKTDGVRIWDGPEGIALEYTEW